MKKPVRIVGAVIKGILLVVVGVLAVYNVYMLIARYAFHNDMPTFFGVSFAVVASGSMEPEIAVGDVIVTAAQPEYGVGDIVTYRDDAHGGHVTHRIIRFENGAIVTKGDANNAEDAPVQTDAIVGKVVAVWAGFGSVVTFFQSPLGLFIIIGAGVVIWLLTDLLTGAFRKRNEEEQHEKN